MDALTALHSRNSINLLTEPAASKEQLTNIFKAGLRACDHKGLRPWRFLLIEGDARNQFAELMVKTRTAMDGKKPDAALEKKLLSKPLRAPSIIVVVAKITEHDKVPEIEQVLSAGAAAQMMMIAAHAQGLGAIWRSGGLMFRPEMRDGLGLNKRDQIVGFLYVGTPQKAKQLPELDPADFVEIWEG